MINFIQFLSEARLAPLYHGTNVEFLISMIRDGRINAKTLQEAPVLMKQPYKVYRKIGLFSSKPIIKIDPKNETPTKLISGVSLTRDFNFAKMWGKDGQMEKGYAILTLNQDALSRRFEIKPFNYFYGGGARNPRHTEAEEFVVTKVGIPLKYITKIDVFTNKDTFSDIKAELDSNGLGSIPVTKH